MEILQLYYWVSGRCASNYSEHNKLLKKTYSSQLCLCLRMETDSVLEMLCSVFIAKMMNKVHDCKNSNCM